MIATKTHPRRVTIIAALLVGLAGTGVGPAAAATYFTSSVDLTATVSLGEGAPWSALGFASGTNFYSVGAEVLIPGGFKVSSVNQSVTREAIPPEPYDQTFANGGIAPAIFKDEKGSMDYPGASATSSNGTASAIGKPSGSGASFTMKSSVAGEAKHQVGFAAASVRWMATTFFTNLTSEALTVIWAVTYTLDAVAGADHPPKDRAVVETKIFAGIGSNLSTEPKNALDFILAGDPPIDPPKSEVAVRPNPPSVTGNNTYTLFLAPGATEKFTVVVNQFGTAKVNHVPLPASAWLFLAALGALAIVSRRRMA